MKNFQNIKADKFSQKSSLSSQSFINKLIFSQVEDATNRLELGSVFQNIPDSVIYFQRFGFDLVPKVFVEFKESYPSDNNLHPSYLLVLSHKNVRKL